jgi:intracellular septation protein A
MSDLAHTDTPFTWSTLAPAMRRAVVRFAIVGISPIVAFYIAFRLSGPMEAIAVGTITASTALALQALRTHRFDPIGIGPIATVLIQGGAGLAFQSVDVYLAAPAVENVLWGLVLLISVAVGRPLVVAAALELKLLPPELRGTSEVKRALSNITILWGLMFFVKAAIRLALLSALPLEEFLVVNTVTITSLNVLLVMFTVWYPVRAARRRKPVSMSSAATS